MNRFFKGTGICKFAYLISGSFFGLFHGSVMAQTGINTKTPRATLDVVASSDDTEPVGVMAPNLTGEQLKARDGLYGNDQDGTIVFVSVPLTTAATSDKTYNVLDKGYYMFNANQGISGRWTKMFGQKMDGIYGGMLGSANQGAPVTISSSGGNNVFAELLSHTFTLDRPSVVFVSFSVPVTNVLRANGQNLTDGASKLIGTNVWIRFQNNTEYLLSRASMSYTNAGTNFANSGYQLNGARTVTLEAGTYTIVLQVHLYAQDSNGVRATFGDNNQADTVFDVFVDALDGA